MTPIYRTSNMEAAVNLMAKNIRNVLLDASSWVRDRVRIRANLLEANCYFDAPGVTSQSVLWQNNGGILIRKDRTHDFDNDAIFFQECPRSIEILDRAARLTRSFAVVYEPPTWRPFYESVDVRFVHRSEKQRYMVRCHLDRMRQLLESSERFTPRVLERILLARQGQIPRPSSVPGSPSVSARSPDIRRGAS